MSHPMTGNDSNPPNSLTLYGGLGDPTGSFSIGELSGVVGGITSSREAAYQELAAVFAEASQGGSVVDATRGLAAGLLAVLPPEVSDPEISADPKGWLNLNWQTASDAMLSISVRAGDRPIFARYFRGSALSGRFDFAPSFPRSVTEEILLVCDAPAGRLLRTEPTSG